MDKLLVKKYLQYASSDDAFAVLFVKKYLENTKAKWVEILDIENHRYYYIENLEFKSVQCALYDRKLKPVYPNNSEFKTQKDYEMACRAITWETANRDISNQRINKVKPIKYLIQGVKYNSTKGNDYFIDTAPSEIKDLAKDLNDRTNPLWDKALQYARKPNYVFTIKQIQRID
jgi:hypothetical protein